MEWKGSLIARFMGPTWGPSGADRTQVGPTLAPWTLLSGLALTLAIADGLVLKDILVISIHNTDSRLLFSGKCYINGYFLSEHT